MNSASNLSKDEPITAAIEREIRARMQPDAPPINVAARGATVTLTGHVANQATKDALNQLARDTKGVIDVTDNLVIGGGHPFLDWFFPGREWPVSATRPRWRSWPPSPSFAGSCPI